MITPNGHALSREAPAFSDMPEEATALELAQRYASIAAFIMHQWPVLIKTLDRIEERQVAGRPQSHQWLTIALAVVVAVMGTWIATHR